MDPDGPESGPGAFQQAAAVNRARLEKYRADLAEWRTSPWGWIMSFVSSVPDVNADNLKLAQAGDNVEMKPIVKRE